MNRHCSIHPELNKPLMLLAIMFMSMLISGCAELIRVPFKVAQTGLEVGGHLLGFASDTLSGSSRSPSPQPQPHRPAPEIFYVQHSSPVKVEPVFSCSQPVINVIQKTKNSVTIKVRFHVNDEKNRGSSLVLNERFWISKREVDIGRKRNNVSQAGSEVVSELILTRKEFHDLQKFHFTYSYEVTNDRGRQCFASSTEQIARK